MKITLICTSRKRGVLGPTAALLRARAATGSTVKVRWVTTLAAPDAIATVKVNLPSTFVPNAKRSATLAFAILAPLRGDEGAAHDAVARCAALARSSKSAIALVARGDLAALSRALRTRDRGDSAATCALHPVAAVLAPPAIAAAMLAFIEAEARELIDATVESGSAQTARDARARMEILKRVGPSAQTDARQLLSVFKTIRGVCEARAEDIEEHTAIGREGAARIAAAWRALKEE
jgi:hypothetical protein